MSYITADKIVDLYSGLLINIKNLRQYQKYGYSDLKGYDVIDIVNAMKLIIAYRFFNNEKIEDTNNYVSAASSAISAFSTQFFPDEIAQKLKLIDLTDDRQAVLDYFKLTRDSDLLEMNKLLNPQETPESFLKFCTFLGTTNTDYWETVYSRLGITWETNNDRDRIYFIIKNKYLFTRTENQEKITTSLTIKEKHLSSPKNIFKILRDKVFPSKSNL